ncbi:MAG: FG-GAP repeat protein, partial [Polyangia bacterium]
MSVSCASLTTDCRVFTDPPANRCAGFGECASSTALSECTAYTDLPDGTACSSACGGMGMCVAGGCACMSMLPEPFVRPLPAASGCSVSPSGDPGAPAFVLLLALALAFRRRLRVAALLLFAGCSGNQVALEVTLHLDDPVLVATDHARIVISGDGTSFPAMAAATIKPGLTVTNEDADGDGKIDIVLTLARDYAFARDNRFRLLNDPIATPLGLTLRAETFDNLGNRFARIGGMAVDPAATSVQALLTPGQQTQAAQLKPACFNQCSDATLHLTVADATLSVTLSDAPTALAVGGVGRNDALVGSAHADSTQGGLARPNGGLARLYQGGATPSTMPNLTIAGAAGNELGAAAAIADLDGDGNAELLLGAPGANSGAGAVYVIWGGASPSATIDLASATLPAFVSVVTGTQTNDRLGVSLAVADLNGDGKPDLLAGADGAAAAYANTTAALPRGAATAAAQLPSATGPSGSRFGASLAAAAGRIVVGAPTQGSKGAVYTLGSADFATPAKAAGSPTAGRGGGFGDVVTAIDVDGSGTALAVAAAPDDGPGTTSVLSSSPMIVQATA